MSFVVWFCDIWHCLLPTPWAILIENQGVSFFTMHELAVTTGILDVALEANRQNGDKKSTAIDLVIG